MSSVLAIQTSMIACGLVLAGLGCLLILIGLVHDAWK